MHLFIAVHWIELGQIANQDGFTLLIELISVFYRQ